MHIVYVTPELNYDNGPQGGLGTFIANMAKIMADHGHFVEIILATSQKVNESFDKRIKVYNLFVEKDIWDEIDLITRDAIDNDEMARELRIELLNAIKSNDVKKQIEKIDSQTPIDIIHFSNHGAFSRYINDDIPYVIRVSGLMNICKGGGNIPFGDLSFSANKLLPRDKSELKELTRCKNVIAPSKLIAEILSKEIGVHGTIIESPFLINNDEWDTTVFDQSLKSKRYVLFYGTCSFLKGIHVIADLVESFLCSHSDYYFVICGKDTVINVENDNISAVEYVRLKANEYKDRVLYLGLLRRNQLYPIIQKAECCIFPSRIENLSNACIEAMSMGKIVIATEGASFEQLIVDKKNGFLCKRDCSDNFLNALERAIGLTESEKKAICDNALNRIKELAPDKIYEQYFHFYSEVISNKLRRRN